MFNPTRFEEMVVSPPERPIAVDGDLSEWSGAWQLEQINSGHHLLPFLGIYGELDEDAIREIARLKLPLCFLSGQWEADRSRPPCIGLPADQNPNVVTIGGQIEPGVSPFGPVEPWREMGRQLTVVPRVVSAQQTSPDPPLVLFISNNEHGKLSWLEAEKERRYLERYESTHPSASKLASGRRGNGKYEPK